MKKLIKFLIVGTIIISVQLIGSEGFSSSKIYPRRTTLLSTSSQGDDGEPLFLTPLIDAGKLEEGRNLSRVTNLTDIVSFSGFVTVNAKYNSNMFFWFFPAAVNPRTAPLLVWLQGGPGASSLFGLFVENGPFRVDQNMNLVTRNTAWTLTHSVIYIENPVGAGFSFTEDEQGYARTEDDVARDLYSALTQFFTLFPDYVSRDFYVTGESYAGKYIPAIAYKIHKENQGSPKIKINLKGMAIGDGFSDPVNMLNFGTYLNYIGLINDKEVRHFHQEEEAARRAIRNKEWVKAFEIIDALIDGDVSGISYFTNVTGFTFYFNYLMPDAPVDQNYYSAFLQQSHIRRAIHVGNQTYGDNPKVEKLLAEDLYQSVICWIEELLDAPEGYKLLIYSGQLDIIVAHVNTEQMLRKMNWSGAKAFSVTEKKKWKVGRDVAGYVRKERNLTYLLVRNAGHILPYDQPKWSFDMINRFTRNKPFA